MKKTFVFLALSLFFVNIYAGEFIKLRKSNQEALKHFKLISSDITSSVVHFTLNGFYKNIVSTEKGNAWLISSYRGASIMKKGAPDLPQFATSLIIPDKANMDIVVISALYKEFDGVVIAPSKGNLLRTVKPDTIPYQFGPVYQQNDYYPGKTCKLRKPYILRDYRGQVLLIRPFQYNPVTKVLRVYYDITVKVKSNGISKINTLTRNSMPEKIDSRFHEIYVRHFLNFNTGNRYTPVDEHGNMLIIAYGNFINAIQPYVNWKIKTGTPVETVDVATIGGAPQIKQYIANYYNTNGLTFVLLVGDAPQVPASVIGGNDSDNDYSYVVGNDHYPDLFVGRFSAETEAQVNTMVQRTLDYEQNPPADTAWFTKCIGIGSDQGPGDDGEFDYQHIRNIQNNKLIPFTYNYGYEFFDGSQGGNDAPGDPTPAMVADAINSGATIINYCGHGSTTSWGTSGFNNNNVNNLVNDNHLPFIFSVACVNGNFVNNTCFAEAWTRATHNGAPTGAMATIMSTINQSWNPPMCGQDEMNDILAETYANNIKRTFGGITMNGCMEMNDEYGSDGDEMTDTWTIFGDPALIIRTAIPQNMTVNIPAELGLGDSTLTVMTNTTEGTACLSLNGVILSSAIIDSNGVANLSFDPLTTIDTADFVVTSFNFRPFISQIPIINVNGPYVSLASNTIDDDNGNGQLDYNENSYLTLGMTNIGNDTANNILTKLYYTGSYVTVTDSAEFYGTILENDTVTINDGFRIYISDSVSDNTLAIFTVVSHDTVTGENWMSSFGKILHAPKLQFSGFFIDDSQANNNGRLDPGETANIEITLNNAGSSEAYNVLSQLTSNNQYITIANSQQYVGNITAGNAQVATYQVSVASDAPNGTTAIFNVDISADFNRSASGTFNTYIGLKPVGIIKLADTEPSCDSMMTCFNILQVNADTLSELPNDLSNYKSLFVLLGTYPNNYKLTNSEGELLANYLDNGGRLYMEGGDTWAFDNPTPVHPLFHIEGLEDGQGDLSTIVGTNNSMMHDLQFDYVGNNNYIDHIAPDDSSVLIFNNLNPEYGTAVSFENTSYKTIGSSFEFAGLANSIGNEKDEVMARILTFFNVGYTWTSIKENTLDNFNFNIYPNPFKDKLLFTIKLNKSVMLDISLYDISGKKIVQIKHEHTNAGLHKIIWHVPEKNFNSGIYFVKISAGNNSTTKKLILTRF